MVRLSREGLSTIIFTVSRRKAETYDASLTSSNATVKDLRVELVRRKERELRAIRAPSSPLECMPYSASFSSVEFFASPLLMATHSSSPNLSNMLTERLLSMLFIPKERNIEDSHLSPAPSGSCKVRFCNVELASWTPAKVLQKGSSNPSRNLTPVTDAFLFRPFAIIALPSSGNTQVYRKIYQ
jgi:hypothetical protein